MTRTACMVNWPAVTAVLGLLRRSDHPRPKLRGCRAQSGFCDHGACADAKSQSGVPAVEFAKWSIFMIRLRRAKSISTFFRSQRVRTYSGVLAIRRGSSRELHRRCEQSFGLGCRGNASLQWAGIAVGLAGAVGGGVGLAHSQSFVSVCAPFTA